MRPRFHVPDLDPSAERVWLPADEAAHLSRVLRLGVGSAIDVIDGRGGLWHAEVMQVDKRAAAIRLLEPGLAAPELRLPITLVPSALKADKMDDVVRDAVMLGVQAIQPIVSERAEVSLAALAKGGRAARWQRIAVASAKQCGRAVVPGVAEPMTLDAYLRQPMAGVRLFCVEPQAGDVGVRPVQGVPRPVAAHVMVGPEGGWSIGEVAAAVAADAMPVSLGGRTLRADAAPMVALVALLTTWGEI